MSRSGSVNRKPRNTARQREAGAAARAETRRRLVLAAAEVFGERGYAGATVANIATQAGVSLQTLYSAWGSKSALLRAYMEYALSGSPTAVTDDTWRHQAQAAVEELVRNAPGAEARLRAAAEIFRQVADRSALAWQLYQDAAAVDPVAAADRAEFDRGRRRTWRAMLAGLDPTELRTGTDLDQALDTALAIASPATYDVLVRDLGYSHDRYQQWVADTLVAALIPDHRLGQPTTAAGRQRRDPDQPLDSHPKQT